MQPLRIWTGPVASEKTTRAMLAAQRMRRQGWDLPFVVRPTCSVRAHEKDENGNCLGFLVAKSPEGIEMKFPSLELDRAADILGAICGWGAAWFDEVPLWDDEEVAFEQIQTARRKMPILVSSLAGTSEMHPFFSSMPRLLAVADRVRFCQSDCDWCGTLGSATRSICLVSKEGLKLVGGEDTYRPACPSCWTKWEAANIDGRNLMLASSCAS